jgi:hypothetical protein
MNEQQQIEVAAPARKRLAAFQIIEREGLEKAIFSRVGTAFVNKDGSLNIYLDAIPLGGKIQVREERDRSVEWAQRRAGTLAASAEAKA